MEFKSGSGWKACFDESTGRYYGEFGGIQSYHLFEITKEMFEHLSEEMTEGDACDIMYEGRHLYMSVDDRCGPPYTVVFDDDYEKLCPWARVMKSGRAWTNELTDAAVELFASEKDNRDQRREKRTKREWIARTEEFLKQRFDEAIYLNQHKDAKAYRIEHTYRVANIGKTIARSEGFDETEMVIACLLHDVSYCEEFGENGWKDHGRHSAEIARPFLRELGLAEDRIDDICYGIAIHVDDEAGFAGERTPFALTVGDADNIDRFDVYRIHESLSFDGFLEKELDEKLDYAKKRLDRLRELAGLPMATATAQELWKSRIDFYIGFYEKLVEQIKSSRSILD